MYRFTIREQVIYGHFREYLEISNELRAYAATKGWADWTLWAPTVGAMNEAVMTAEYDSLAAFEQESRAVETDAEFMKLVRRSAEHVVQGSSRSEMLETVTEIA
jgi:hypothetical protein